MANVYARRVLSDGTPTGSVINVSVGLPDERDPDLAFGSVGRGWTSSTERLRRGGI